MTIPARPWWGCVALTLSALAAGSLTACSSGPAASPTALPSAPTTAADLDPANLVLSSEAWTFESKDGKLIRTPSYNVYTTVTKPQLASRIPIFLERCLINYTSSLGALPAPTSHMDTYMLATRPQWERLTQRVMGDEADVYLKIQRGGFSANGKAVLYDIGPRDTFAITAHEGWHQYTQRTFRSPLPVALEEGLATYMEGFRWDPDRPDTPRFLPWANFERFEQLRADTAACPPAPRAKLQDAAHDDLIPEDRAHAGPRAASTLLSRRTGVDLIGIYTGQSAEDLEGSYRAFIDRIVRVGSRQRIAAGKSPIPD